jgi:membrane protein DedA with SNARE-associated domain
VTLWPAGDAAARVWTLLRTHGPATAFVWGAGKSLVPVPAPSVFTLAGAVESHRGTGVLAAMAGVFLRVALPGAAGILLGGWPYYRWGRRGGWPVLERWGPRLGIRKARLERWRASLERRRWALIFVLRVLPVAPIALGSVLAGVAQAGLWEYAIWTFLGAVPRVMILGGAGWAMRESSRDLGWRFAPWEAALVLGLAAVLLAAAAARVRKKKAPVAG